jgi:ribosomal protein S18 acetylase RimI-like enzyme
MEVMEFRTPTPDDGPRIREIARRSLESSYTLSPQTIESAVAQWYDDEAIARKLDDDQQVMLLAHREGQVVGFVEGALVADGEADLQWLHVDPDYRGEGIARTMFEEARDRLEGMGADRLRGRVLRVNPSGNDFYDHYGFVKAGEDTAVIDGTTYIENIYVDDEPAEMESAETDDGRTVYVDTNDADRGNVGPFYTVYLDRTRSTRYGFQCGNCGGFDVAMDAMGRAQCNACGNERKATRWDAAYL